MLPLKQLKPFFRGRLPGQLIIQFSNLCNANCPQCGMRRTTLMPHKAMATSKVKQLIDTAAERGVQALSLTGGEPLLYLDELTEFTHHARKAGIPYVRTGTNGFIFAGHDKPGFEKRMHDTAERLSKVRKNRVFYKILWKDLAYYRACKFFDGTLPPDYNALRAFS